MLRAWSSAGEPDKSSSWSAACFPLKKEMQEDSNMFRKIIPPILNVSQCTHYNVQSGLWVQRFMSCRFPQDTISQHKSCDLKAAETETELLHSNKIQTSVSICLMNLNSSRMEYLSSNKNRYSIDSNKQERTRGLKQNYCPDRTMQAASKPEQTVLLSPLQPLHTRICSRSTFSQNQRHWAPSFLQVPSCSHPHPGSSFHLHTR